MHKTPNYKRPSSTDDVKPNAGYMQVKSRSKMNYVNQADNESNLNREEQVYSINKQTMNSYHY